MRNMFQSATLKLTGWYLLIIMTVSIAFSAAIYQFALSEFSARLDVVQSEVERSPRFNPPSDFLMQVRADQYEVASHSFLNGLIYVNLIILFSGGLGSYALARRTLQPIEEANLTQVRFIADASHQLRTPLAIMKAELETAQRGGSLKPKEANELIASTLEEVDKLSVLSGRLLELTHFDEESSKADQKVFSLTKLVGKAATHHRKTADRIKLNTESDLNIKAYQPHIEELLDILIENALKYSPNKSTVEITLKKSDKYAELSVSNRGKGIPEQDLDKVFDRFYRSNQPGSAKGFGLGLAIAKKIVESYNGEIYVTSAANQQTTFKVLLPLAS